jgi:phage terminase small subunit
MVMTTGRPSHAQTIREAKSRSALAASDQSLISEVPDHPSELESPYAQEYWQYICGLKIQESDLRHQWLPVIFQLCKAYEFESQLEAEIEKNFIIYGEGNKPYRNPLLTDLQNTRGTIVAMLKQLRLTPAAVAGSRGGGKTIVMAPPRSRTSMN